MGTVIASALATVAPVLAFLLMGVLPSEDGDGTAAPPVTELRPAELPAWALVTLGLAAVLLLGLLGYALSRLPRALARCEAAVGPAGIELAEHRAWWRPGRRALLPWDSIALVMLRSAYVPRGKRTVPGQVLDVFLHRPADGLPDYAAGHATPREESADFGRALPPFFVRLGSPSPQMAESVRQVAGQVAAYRPDLLLHPDPRTAAATSRVGGVQARPFLVAVLLSAVCVTASLLIAVTLAAAG